MASGSYHLGFETHEKKKKKGKKNPQSQADKLGAAQPYVFFCLIGNHIVFS